MELNYWVSDLRKNYKICFYGEEKANKTFFFFICLSTVEKKILPIHDAEELLSIAWKVFCSNIKCQSHHT